MVAFQATSLDSDSDDAVLNRVRALCDDATNTGQSYPVLAPCGPNVTLS